MADIFDKYFQNRILNAVLNKKRNICFLKAAISPKDINEYRPEWNPQEIGLYKVKSQTTPNLVYTVDIVAGVCECVAGACGKLCKHQQSILIHNELKSDRWYNGSMEEKKKVCCISIG